jgi:hypothetical protein
VSEVAEPVRARTRIPKLAAEALNEVVLMHVWLDQPNDDPPPIGPLVEGARDEFGFFENLFG